MCVLCEKENLRLLVSPLTSLSHRELADAIAIAREAAWQLVLDTADAITERDPDGEGLSPHVGPDGYLDYIVDRAERDGAIEPGDVAFWNGALRDESILRDPRV